MVYELHHEDVLPGAVLRDLAASLVHADAWFNAVPIAAVLPTRFAGGAAGFSGTGTEMLPRIDQAP